jgi:MFS family permease
MIARISRSPVLAVWARLELSAIVWMVLGVLLSARPLLEVSTAGLQGALATTANVFSAFILGELVGMPVAAWLRGAPGGRVVRPVAAVVGIACAVAGIVAVSPGARAVCYGLAGAGAEVVASSLMTDSVKSPLLRRSTELVVLAATCAAVVGLGAGLFLAASGPPQVLWALALCGAGQATVVLITVTYTLYPPPRSEFPLA